MMNRPVSLCMLLAGGVIAVVAGSYLAWSGSRQEAPLSAGAERVERSTTAGAIDAGASRTKTFRGTGGRLVAVPSGKELRGMLDRMLADYDSAEVDAWVLGGDLSLEVILAALAHVSAKPSGTPHKADLQSHLYRAWARLAPDQAWKAALAETNAADSGRFLADVAGEIAKERPEEALGLALSLGMGNKRAEVVKRVFAEWGAVDLAGAVAYWNRHPELPAANEVINAAIERMMDRDPAFAASQAMLLRGGNARGPSLAMVLIAWAKKDVAKALQWAKGIDDARMREGQLAIIVDVWAGKDPVAALGYAAEIEDAKGRAIAMRNAWNSWLQKDPVAAMDYLAANSSADLLDSASMYFAYATESLTSAEQQVLLDRIPDSKTRQSIAIKLVRRQIEHGRYPQAIEALNRQQDSNERDSALRHLGEWWGRDDAKAAEAWLESMRDSSDRDLVTEGFARSLAESDPRAALEWITAVSDKGVREGGLKNIALQWLSREPQAAEAWLAEQTWLSDEMKGELRRMASTPGAPVRMTYGANVTNRR